jgi:hypothetical protein
MRKSGSNQEPTQDGDDPNQYSEPLSQFTNTGEALDKSIREGAEALVRITRDAPALRQPNSPRGGEQLTAT